MTRVFVRFALIFVLAACAEARAPESATRERETVGGQPTAAESGSGAGAVSPVMRTPQMQALQRNLSRSSAGLHAEARSGGVRKVDLQGRFLHATVLEHRVAGEQRRVCVDHPSAMSALF